MDSKTETVSDKKCAQCGWTEDNHRNGYCYHYSDEDTDYFYTDRKFISKKSLVGEKYYETVSGRIIVYPLRDGIIDVLKTWDKPNGDFDAMWYGYESLLDELKERGYTPKLTRLKKEIKQLASEGIIELLPLHDDEHKICGRGWFINSKSPDTIK